MTIPVIIAIVIGLTIVIISLFIIMGRGKTLQQVGQCKGLCKQCSADDAKCPADKRCPKEYPNLGLTPCTAEDGKTQGRCCSNLLG